MVEKLKKHGLFSITEENILVLFTFWNRTNKFSSVLERNHLIENSIEKSTENIVDRSLAIDIFDAQDEDGMENNELLEFSDSEMESDVKWFCLLYF